MLGLSFANLMRKLSSAALTVALLGIAFACNFGSKDSPDSSLPMEGPPNPELLQYAEDLTLSWNARYTAKTWRSEIEDVQGSGPVHIVTEAICPARYHVLVTGTQNTDTYYIDKLMYQRKAREPWVKTTLPMSYQGLSFCSKAPPESVDAARIRLVAEQLRDIDLSKPVVREIAGRKCREWTRTFSNGKVPYNSTNCYDVSTHELVQSVGGHSKATYYWNVPLDIKPPI